ncbi:MAG: GAF domain-containing protein [Deltaproteobacteria bacterium]|nr:GAF domain-containing protein [Deltaproteobacteria bacterium]
MANFNVFVPARKGSDMPDLTLKVEASNWLVALKESLKQIGEQGDSLANIVCETAPDGSIRVADPASRRVFLIAKVDSARDAEFEKEAERRAAESRSLAEAAEKAHKETEARLKDVQDRMSAAPAAAAQPAPEAAETARQVSFAPAAPTPAPAVDETARRLEDEKRRLEAELAEAKAKLEAAARKAADEATGVLGHVEVAKVEKKPAAAVKSPAAAARPAREEWGDLDDWYDGVDTNEETIDGVVSDLFLATANLHEKNESESALEVLKLAAKYVSTEAASIFYSDMNSALKDLVIVAASGPVGGKILGVRIPLGKGIVGFSVVNGVKLIVNSVDRNPNFYGKLDQEFGFKTHSILCVPIQHGERTYGAIEMINKKGEDDTWTTNDANVLESLAKILGRAVETSISSKKD